MGSGTGHGNSGQCGERDGEMLCKRVGLWGCYRGVRTMYRGDKDTVLGDDKDNVEGKGCEDRLWKTMWCKEGMWMVHVGTGAAQGGSGRGNAWGEGERAVQGETEMGWGRLQ